MTVKQLKEKLERAISKLDEYDENAKVDMVSNTYFLKSHNFFVGLSGYDGGYIDLTNPVDEDDIDLSEFDEEEE